MPKVTALTDDKLVFRPKFLRFQRQTKSITTKSTASPEGSFCDYECPFNTLRLKFYLKESASLGAPESLRDEQGGEDQGAPTLPSAHPPLPPSQNYSTLIWVSYEAPA